jgi:hypothetical protein
MTTLQEIITNHHGELILKEDGIPVKIISMFSLNATGKNTDKSIKNLIFEGITSYHKDSLPEGINGYMIHNTFLSWGSDPKLPKEEQTVNISYSAIIYKLENYRYG